jgi:protease II
MTNMMAGHQGSSGRYGAVAVDARVMAWLLTLARP